MYKTVLVTGPQAEPINLDEVKAHLHISGDDEDLYLSTLIVTARKQIERFLNRALITQTWKVYYNTFCSDMKIPFGNLQSSPAVIVKYYNLEGTLTTLASTNYWVHSTTDPACILKAYDTVYPETQYGRPDSVEITFVCGFGATAADVPAEIKHAMKIMVANMHSNREDVVVGTITNRIPHYISDLIHSYKLYQF
jgi:uncharacterized phiE125 gp8 family phage protein